MVFRGKLAKTSLKLLQSMFLNFGRFHPLLVFFTEVQNQLGEFTDIMTNNIMDKSICSAFHTVIATL